MQKHIMLGNTETAKNVAKAFAGESQARNRYTFYAEKAKEEGFFSIAHVFLETADNERGHAEALYEFLSEGIKPQEIVIEAGVLVSFGTTPQNLQAAAHGEAEEASRIYLQFAAVAHKEGFHVIAESFSKFAGVEKRHCARFQSLFDRYKRGMLYKLPYDANWKCLNCGYIHMGKSAPERCPACLHPQSYFIAVCNDITLV